DRDAPDVMFAAHGDLDQAAARGALDDDLGEGILRLFHVFLHLLGLTHQACELTFHHGVIHPDRYLGKDWDYTAGGRTDPGTTRALKVCTNACTMASSGTAASAASWRAAR